LPISLSFEERKEEKKDKNHFITFHVPNIASSLSLFPPKLASARDVWGVSALEYAVMARNKKIQDLLWSITGHPKVSPLTTTTLTPKKPSRPSLSIEEVTPPLS